MSHLQPRHVIFRLCLLIIGTQFFYFYCMQPYIFTETAQKLRKRNFFGQSSRFHFIRLNHYFSVSSESTRSIKKWDDKTNHSPQPFLLGANFCFHVGCLCCCFSNISFFQQCVVGANQWLIYISGFYCQFFLFVTVCLIRIRCLNSSFNPSSDLTKLCN